MEVHSTDELIPQRPDPRQAQELAVAKRGAEDRSTREDSTGKAQRVHTPCASYFHTIPQVLLVHSDGGLSAWFSTTVPFDSE